MDKTTKNVLYFKIIYKMDDLKTTEWVGAEPTAENDFEAEALEIINSIEDWEWKKEWESTTNEDSSSEDVKTPSEEKEDKEQDKEEDEEEDKNKEDENKKEQVKEEEELKIPRSRLNKEIDKRKSVEKKYEKLLNKIEKEKENFSKLSDDEKEEQANLRKLWLDTRLSKMEDKMEELKEELEEREETIKSLQEDLNKKETEAISKRISELTKQYDWKDWLPKFNIEELIKFSKEKNFFPKDPYELYKYKYSSEIYAKKYKTKTTEVDKWNKWNFTPTKRKPSFKNWDKDFEEEAQRILNSFGQTK